MRRLTILGITLSSLLRADLGIIDRNGARWTVYEETKSGQVKLARCPVESIPLDRTKCLEIVSVHKKSDFYLFLNASFGIPSAFSGSDSISRLSATIEEQNMDLTDAQGDKELADELHLQLLKNKRLLIRLIRLQSRLIRPIQSSEYRLIDEAFEISPQMAHTGGRILAAFNTLLWHDGNNKVFLITSASINENFHRKVETLCPFPFRFVLQADFTDKTLKQFCEFAKVNKKEVVSVLWLGRSGDYANPFSLSECGIDYLYNEAKNAVACVSELTIPVPMKE